MSQSPLAAEFVLWALFLAAPLSAADPPGLVARLGADRLRQTSGVEAITYSPDGSHLASADGDSVVIWDAGKGQRIRTIPVKHKVVALRYAADGRTLYAAGANAEDRTCICRIDPAAGRLLDSKPVIAGKWTAEFSPDCAWLAMRNPKGALFQVVDLAAREVIPYFGLDLEEVFTGVAWRPDSQVVAIGTGAGRVRLYSPKTGKMLHEHRFQGEAVESMTFSPDGKDLVAEIGDPDWAVRFDAATGEVRWKHPTSRANQLHFSADGKAVVYFGSSSQLREVPRWHWLDAATGKPLGLDMDSDYGRASVRPDGKVLALGGCDGLISQWDLATRRRVEASGEPSTGVVHLQFSPDGTRVRGWARGWYEWDVKTGTQTRLTPKLDVGESDIFVVSADRRWLGTFGPGRIDLPRQFDQFDLSTGRRVRSLDNIDGYDLLRFLPNGGLLAIGHTELSIAPETSGSEVHRIPTGHTHRAVATADGKTAFVVARSDDGARVAVWNLTTGKKTGEWTAIAKWQAKEPEPWVYEGGVSPDNRRIVIHFPSYEGLGPRTLARVFDTRTGRRVGEWTPPYALNGVFSPDGRTFAYPGTRTARAELWEVATGQRRIALGDAGTVHACAFSPDARLLAVSLQPGPLEIWDTSGGRAGADWKWTPDVADRYWDKLQQATGAEPHQALCELRNHPAEVIPFLKERMKVPAGPTDEWIAARIQTLDAPTFRDRERATDELARLGDAIDDHLYQALATASPEARTRLEGLIRQLIRKPVPMTPDDLRAIRVCEVLEGIATIEARELLAAWAKGAPGATLTREASGSLGRLARRGR